MSLFRRPLFNGRLLSSLLVIGVAEAKQQVLKKVTTDAVSALPN